MKTDDMLEAIEESNRIQKLVDYYLLKFLKFCVGRLRTVNGYFNRKVLCDLKKELKDFNMTTRTWKNEN